jgi:hypothetical protein
MTDDRRGIFRLKQVYEMQFSNIWPKPDSLFGYFGGGNFPSFAVSSRVDRIDYSNDTATASVRGPLSASRTYFAATGNKSYGWFGGGGSVSPGTTLFSSIHRINYSNDTATGSTRGPLSQSRERLAATGNNDYGWFGGGNAGSPSVIVSRVDRIDYSNDDTTALLRGPLDGVRFRLAATSNSSFGWFGGGGNEGGNPQSSVFRIDYSNDDRTTLSRASFNNPRHYLAATGNKSYGWFGGGSTPIPAPSSSIVERIDYSNDFITPLTRGTLSFTLELAATGNSFYGYFGGGSVGAPGPFSTVERIDYSNDTVTASPRGPLSLARKGLAACSAAANGLNQPQQQTIIIPAQSFGGKFGYFGGGSPIKDGVDRIDYSNDTVTAAIRGSLSSPRTALTATGNSSYGWFGGGVISSLVPLSTVDRIDYSNDHITASPRGPLSLARRFLAATGNSSYGWFGGGGLSPSNADYLTIDRIDFSNDTATASPRGSLSLARRGLDATGNSSYGWFGGGGTGAPITAVSRVDRIDYSNDTVTASSRGSLSASRYSLGATGNSSYGWFGGGSTPGAIQVSRVDRIDYSNDTVTASLRGPLSLARDTKATGNSSYGWFGGGGVSSVDRIDYSNDTSTASPRGPLSAARSNSAASSATANALPQ